jgi:hypothetical protein
VSNKANQHQKPEIKNSIDAKKPNSDKLPRRYFFYEWLSEFR